MFSLTNFINNGDIFELVDNLNGHLVLRPILANIPKDDYFFHVSALHKLHTEIIMKLLNPIEVKDIQREIRKEKINIIKKSINTK